MTTRRAMSPMMSLSVGEPFNAVHLAKRAALAPFSRIGLELVGPKMRPLRI